MKIIAGRSAATAGSCAQLVPASAENVCRQLAPVAKAVAEAEAARKSEPMPTSEPICGAIATLDNDLGNVVCAWLPSLHAGLYHYDPDLGVRWPICPTYCGQLAGSTRHVCGQYRGDTAHPYD